MKQILYLRTDICGSPLNIGGSIGHTLGVINFFKNKYKISVFSSAMKQVLRKESDIHFIPLQVYKLFFFFADRVPILWRGYYLSWRLNCIFSNIFFTLQVLFKSRNNQYVFIYQRYSILNCTGALLSKWWRIPLILEYNGSEAYWFKPLQTAPWYERWFAFDWFSQWVEQCNLRCAKEIVVVSQTLKDDLIERGVKKEKILVNPNGVEEQIFSGAQLMSKREAVRLQYGLEESFVFGFIGTFGHWHGIEMIEKIVPLICDKYSEAKFFLIGDGSLKPSLEQNIKKYIDSGQVVLPGKIEQHKAPEYLAACDAYLCPTAPNQDGTRFFGSPTKLFEYMSMAKPVIASDLEQLAEVVSPAIYTSKKDDIRNITITNEVGIVSAPLDVQGFVKACELCLTMSLEARKKLGENARAKVIKNYTWKKHVERIMEHFRNL
jgi:glycosyltransferase involved in cell wall biosynthesis